MTGCFPAVMIVCLGLGIAGTAQACAPAARPPMPSWIRAQAEQGYDLLYSDRSAEGRRLLEESARMGDGWAAAALGFYHKRQGRLDLAAKYAHQGVSVGDENSMRLSGQLWELDEPATEAKLQKALGCYRLAKDYGLKLAELDEEIASVSIRIAEMHRRQVAQARANSANISTGAAKSTPGAPRASEILAVNDRLYAKYRGMRIVSPGVMARDVVVGEARYRRIIGNVSCSKSGAASYRCSYDEKLINEGTGMLAFTSGMVVSSDRATWNFVRGKSGWASPDLEKALAAPVVSTSRRNDKWDEEQRQQRFDKCQQELRLIPCAY